MIAGDAVRLLVISDTHLGAGQGGPLFDEIAEELAAADVILHAGDVTDASVLDALGEFAPVHAVRGNNDRTLTLPERLTIELAGCRIGMVHDSGAAAGRGVQLHHWFPHADLVVFGHSHLPWQETDTRSTDGHVQHQLNPGSAVQRRRAPRRTVATVELLDGHVGAISLVPVRRPDAIRRSDPVDTSTEPDQDPERKLRPRPSESKSSTRSTSSSARRG